ncbi:MAG: DUF3626 domain-containing protein [Microlunatus sp.]
MSAAIDAVAKRALAGPPMPPTARVALHFHPDVDLWGRPVLPRIVAAGTYLSQFATGTSNGGLTAYTGGDRWLWEHRIFDGVYDEVDPVEHPVYGALAVDGDPYGPAPRFGSSYLRLRPVVMERSTFAYPDSVFQPATFGVAARMAPLDLWRRDDPPDPLDHYIEAHVHCRVVVPADVEALVLDPSFVDSGLETIAEEAGMAVEWHPGYELRTDALASVADYRSPLVVGAAIKLAENGLITPASLGRARRRGDEDVQMQKWTWHCLARFGRKS